MGLGDFESSEIALAQCPECGLRTLKSEAGCHECMNPDCGYGICE